MKIFIRFIVLSILTTLVCFPAFAQVPRGQVGIYGAVHSKMTGELLTGVKVVLMNRDSSVVAESYTDKDGQTGSTLSPWEFLIPKKEAQYILKFSKEGYETLYKDISYKPRGNKDIVLYDKTFLKYASKERVLNAATVTTTRVKFYTKKDTVVFNADAF